MTPGELATTRAHGAGELFFAEIREQPAACTGCSSTSPSSPSSVSSSSSEPPAVVRLVGHGSSDAAASYGVYAFGLLPGWTRPGTRSR